MTNLECLRMPWYAKSIRHLIDNMEVTKDQLETIIDGWLVLDDGQFDRYPGASTLYARIMHLSALRYFSTSKKIDDDRVIFGCELPDKQYRYFVK